MKRREFLSYATALSAAAYGCEPGDQATSDTHDLVLKNGRVLDGAGNPWFKADISVRDGRISKIGSVDETQAERVIDVDGLYVSPGFIDVHSHSDTNVFVDPWMESKIRQGITTEVNGNCGGSPVPRRGASEEENNW